jgi:hypothetical protein
LSVLAAAGSGGAGGAIPFASGGGGGKPLTGAAAAPSAEACMEGWAWRETTSARTRANRLLVFSPNLFTQLGPKKNCIQNLLTTVIRYISRAVQIRFEKLSLQVKFFVKTSSEGIGVLWKSKLLAKLSKLLLVNKFSDPPDPKNFGTLLRLQKFTPLFHSSLL